MGRKACPRVFRGWFVTEAGGQGLHKLCLVTAGKKKAQQELNRYLAGVQETRKREEEQGLAHTDTPYLVRHVAAEFLRLTEATKKANTFAFYKKTLKRFVESYGEREVRKLGLAESSEFILKLKEARLSGVSINHCITAAKGVLNYAVECDRIRKNPWKQVRKLPERRRKRVLTDLEFAKLLKACDECIAYKGMVSKEENVQLMKDILNILRYTAMRPGELRHLRWDHLDFKDGEGSCIIIPASEQKTGTTAKKPRDRVIPVLEEAKAIFERRRERHGHESLVFASITGKEWTDQLFSRRFARLRTRAGLDTPDHNDEMIVPYSLRHTRLTEAGVKEGWPLLTLMNFAGHTTPEMTERYVHLSRIDLTREAVEGQKRRKAAEAATAPVG